MPSDPRAAEALEALASRRQAFRQAVESTAAALRGRLARRGLPPAAEVERARAELGPFAAGRVDPERFAALFGPGERPDPAGGEAAAASLAALEGLLARLEQVLRLQVPSGGSLHETAGAGLEAVGEAFAAARSASNPQSGSSVPSLPFAAWSREERRLVPPLVVEVAGADLRAAGLAEFLDGSVKIVLLVAPPAPPAPLARLVAPGTYVLQTTDGAGLADFAAWPGPGIAAWLPPGAARFRHDPAAGASPWQRLLLHELPAPPRAAVGGLSAAQQAEELQHLASLAVRPGNGGAPPDPAGKLAAWLVRGADLSGLP